MRLLCLLAIVTLFSHASDEKPERHRSRIDDLVADLGRDWGSSTPTEVNRQILKRIQEVKSSGVKVVETDKYMAVFDTEYGRPYVFKKNNLSEDQREKYGINEGEVFLLHKNGREDFWRFKTQNSKRAANDLKEEDPSLELSTYNKHLSFIEGAKKDTLNTMISCFPMNKNSCSDNQEFDSLNCLCISKKEKQKNPVSLSDGPTPIMGSGELFGGGVVIPKEKLKCEGVEGVTPMSEEKFNSAKDSCKQAGHKWKNCQCLSVKTGGTLCKYKEKRKITGKTDNSLKAVYRDREGEDWNNEKLTWAPCSIENWMGSIARLKKDIPHCAQWEKIKIKSKAKGNNFKEKRYACQKCKEGYIQKFNEVDMLVGVNDYFMEGPIQGVTACTEPPRSMQCKNAAKEQRKCERRNNDSQIGYEYKFNPFTCECAKRPVSIPENKDLVAQSCEAKVTQGDRDRCYNNGGYLDENCQCERPCYDRVYFNDLEDQGPKCDYLGTELDNTLVKLIEETSVVAQKNCEELTQNSMFEQKKKSLIQKCIDEIGMAPKGIKSRTVSLKLALSEDVSCSVNLTQESEDFGSKFPALVGGVDLAKDFKGADGQRLNPENIDCSRGIRYQKKGFNNKLLKGNECESVKSMYESIKSKANKLAESVINDPNIPESVDKSKMILDNLNLEIIATANRIAHKDGYVSHQELANERASSVRDLYLDFLKESPYLSQNEKFKQAVEKIKQEEAPRSLAYFGPHVKGKSLNEMKSLSGEEMLSYCENRMSSSHEFYQCSVDYHIDVELSHGDEAQSFMKTFSDVYNIRLPEKKEEYRQKLLNLPNGSTEFMDYYKLFNIQATTSESLGYKKTASSDVEFECETQFKDIYDESPKLVPVQVRYGKRPAFFQRFNKQCQEDYQKTINEIAQELSQENAELKNELRDRFEPEVAQEKFDRKMKALARKEWRQMKRNTRSVAKEHDSSFSEAYDWIKSTPGEAFKWGEKQYNELKRNE